METIEVRFADLRRAAEQVPAFVEDRLGGEAEYGLRTGIEEDMGSAGLDTEELLLEFSKQYSVDLSKFDFTGMISPELDSDSNPLFSLFFLFFIIVYAVAWSTKFLVGTVYWPFNPKAATRFIKEPIGNPFASTSAPTSKPRPLCDILTIGDFVASAAAGRFVKRERVRFVLV
ncbi:DUF1493 family protein [Hymenobacter sp. J193]|uniref:DUF1493 family protein n=1 Tax=Hymenobacter sp. J193 TaxID=2898429 RepID=UPI0021513DEB|nr:DUF1493 family protein [Hymenobacter sp. J193]MCR5886224.1 DUF1493 family protein [Hymenobacter sp. J193]MCR5890251.1 DUF1493 family protein [Hymenobacter sp. J193]